MCACVCARALCCFTARLSRWKLTIWVHVVPGHLWGGEPLLERVCAVTVLIHGDQLLLRRRQRCEGVHHALHPIGHHLWTHTGIGGDKRVSVPEQKTERAKADGSLKWKVRSCCSARRLEATGSSSQGFPSTHTRTHTHVKTLH